jgi:glycosyltransferase involved in cell wall biosynthesis
MKVKISTFTPLFFHYTAQYVSRFADTTFIQSYRPNKCTIKIFKLLDLFFKTNFFKMFFKRIPQNFQGKNIGIALPEILMKVGLRFFKDKPKVQSIAHVFYGWLSKLFLSNTDIFHVRSGSGRGGAIKKIKRIGGLVVTDHSIAHPKTMENILLGEYQKYGVPFEFSNCFWDKVIEDCNEADFILVNSDYVKKTFIENGYEANILKVIYLGVREDFIGCKTDYVTSEVLQLLFIGAFGFRKGCEYLLKSIELIEKKGIKFKLTVIGPIVDFQSVIDQYNIDRIEFKGMVLYDDLKEYYRNSDIYIFPSLCEGSTMAGMEAMSAGLPCIFTENCGVPVVNEENGIIIPIKDEYAIADAVELLYKNEHLRKKIGINASDTIKNKYTWKDYQSNIESFYNEIISTVI